ncbi:MAG: hypothetical protein H0T76_29210 [Nannocystis sp.]|nr:hypothetical protein [Nannocystis sp.]MBA3550574.1 hypothetical protein [Nannocystis sp.]
MLQRLALVLAVVLPPDSLSPAAGEHNTRAMRFYDAGQLAPAVDEFFAAYQAMPDARRDLAGRELLLGSMRATLLALHAENGEAAPLCRLQTILQGHADALRGAYPDDPDMLETRSARARHEEVTQQLDALGAHACTLPAPPVPAAVPVTDPPAPTPAAAPPAPALAAAKPASDEIPPRHLRIAGGITLGLSAGLLGVMTYGLVTEASQRARVAGINDKSADCPLTLAEVEALQGHRREAVSGRQLAIGTGVAAGVTAALGTTLLVLARRSARAKRWSAAPWWSPSGAGLTLHVQLGAAH